MNRIFHHTSANAHVTGIYEQDKLFVTRLESWPTGCGYGGSELKRLQTYAATLGKPIHLYSVADDMTKQERLDAFYIRHGFMGKLDSVGNKVFVWTPNLKQN